jgi:hypothetical protein
MKPIIVHLLINVQMEYSPVYPGKRYVDRELDDPAGKSVEAVRPTVEEIDRRTSPSLNVVLSLLVIHHRTESTVDQFFPLGNSPGQRM